MSSTVDLHRLRSFVAVATELNYHRAARKLYIDQGAVSRHIQDLERHYGVLLFRRTRRSVELTAAGRILAAEAEQLFILVDQIRERVAAAGELSPVSAQSSRTDPEGASV